ncbi:methyl-accepting chemotaxis protein [Undibacterium sp. Xuan67W]|uniref:methyl-accepting chemotaxis protein n=1 Tax=Undibacterium sp. Xuan67W TaxID=3413057 RepID=UPI003BF30B25
MGISNLKIGVRLSLGFAFVIGLLVVIVIIGASLLTLINTEIDLTVNDRYHKIDVLNDAKSAVNLQARNLRNILLMTDDAEIKSEIESIHKTSKEVSEDLDKIGKLIRAPKAISLFQDLVDKRKAFASARDQVIQLVNEGKKDEARDLLFKLARPAQLAYFATLEELIKFQENLMLDAAAEAEHTAKWGTYLMIGIGTVAVLVSILIAWLITRSILVPVNRALHIAETVAKGDLTTTFEVEAKDEIGNLLRALKTMNESLVKIVGEVRSGTDVIATASAQIASGNQDLSSRTERQASALEETASSMEELTSTVKQNSDNSRQANQLARSASEVAVKGGQVVSQVVGTMGSITESSNKVVDIISVIDDIAFQTNILALNAAVEAARAGEQGRGFAVVASEVRNLAQRSATAAKEIKTLIANSVEQVKIGSALVDQAGQTMDEVVTSVKRVTDIMEEISAASVEQSAGIDQINQAVIEMDNVTQQNSALVEEIAAASESMQDQARTQADVVSVFKIDQASVNHLVRSDPEKLTNSVRNSKKEVSASATKPRPAPQRPKANTIARQPLVAVAPTKAARFSHSTAEGDWAEF